jgi:protein N-terminal methyltransferase
MSTTNASKQPTPQATSKPGTRYWEEVDADVNGMLGGVPSVAGYSYLSKVDLQNSRSFLAKLGIGCKSGRRKVSRALEGGAGLVLHSPRCREHDY